MSFKFRVSRVDSHIYFQVLFHDAAGTPCVAGGLTMTSPEFEAFYTRIAQGQAEIPLDAGSDRLSLKSLKLLLGGKVGEQIDKFMLENFSQGDQT